MYDFEKNSLTAFATAIGMVTTLFIIFFIFVLWSGLLFEN